MTDPPAQLLGVTGIKKFSTEILKRKHFSNGKLKTARLANYFQIHKDGKTGGGIFRKIYSGFFMKAVFIVNNNALLAFREKFIDLSDRCDRPADDM